MSEKKLHQVAVRLTDDMYAEVCRLAEEQHRSKGAQIVHMLSLLFYKYPFNQYPWNDLPVVTEPSKQE